METPPHQETIKKNEKYGAWLSKRAIALAQKLGLSWSQLEQNKPEDFDPSYKADEQPQPTQRQIDSAKRLFRAVESKQQTPSQTVTPASWTEIQQGKSQDTSTTPGLTSQKLDQGRMRRDKDTLWSDKALGVVDRQK